MSPLQLYTPITQFPNLTAMISLLVTCALLFIQLKIHLIHSSELERLKESIDKRITALYAEMDAMVNRLAPLEDVTKTLLATQEDVKTELWEIDTALKGHGEEIDLAARAAHKSMLLSGGVAAQRHHESLDPYINDFLRDSGSATVSEIFNHLNNNIALTEAWPKLYGEKAPKFTRQDVHRRLYAILLKGKLTMDSSEGIFIWSL
jgi:hypothetical protein